jgi:hypothetical protein
VKIIKQNCEAIEELAPTRAENQNKRTKEIAIVATIISIFLGRIALKIELERLGKDPAIVSIISI